LIVGIIAAIIAWQQSKTAKEQRNIAKAKLNLDLFERRLEIFNATWAAASSVIQSNEPIYAPPSMTNLYPEASFLFRSDIETYMKELAGKMTQLAMIREQTKRNNDILPPDKISETCELEKWIGNAAMQGVRDAFSPYLSFGHWS
jgi:hypothetical protein